MFKEYYSSHTVLFAINATDSVAWVLVGLRRQYINNFVFPTCACADGFNNNNKNNNNNNNNTNNISDQMSAKCCTRT